jgi:putative oxidoreductase
VRRFISSFVNGRPAFGLLLIRIAAGAALITTGRESIYFGEHLGFLILGVFTIVDGVLLTAGLWTPFAGFLALALSASDVLIYRGESRPALLLACLGAGVAFIGPGALSIDAWLFGLKRIDIDKLKAPSVDDSAHR